jgi:hypothetical protein
MMHRPARARLILAAGAICVAVSACGTSERALENRQWSDSFAFRISVDPMPPRAIEDARYKVVVQDKTTGEPIETGQGRIFATSRDGANTDDGLAKGKEVGTYYGRLFYPTSGDWQIALQFRRDSTSKLERVDWTQSVREATGPGS